MGEQYRNELKFVCSERELKLLEERIRHICRLDSHVGADGRYTIRSLYFDTYDDQYFHENEAGIDHRRKYRIRIYDGSRDVIHLECKETLHGLKRKEVCSLSLEQCRLLMDKKPVGGVLSGQDLLGRFLVEQRMLLLQPRVIVEYVRTPYVYAAGNVRITFDRHIRSSAEIGRFLEPQIAGRRVMAQNSHVLEVKYDEGLPGAVREFLSSGRELFRTSLSKYCLCRKYGMG